MKRITLLISSIVLILAMVLSVGMAGCGGGEETTTTPPPATTTPSAPTTTTTPPPAPTTTTPPPGKPAAFTLSNLSIEPAEIDPEGQVTVTVLVKNTGEIKGSYEVNFVVNDETLQYKTVTVDGGAQQTLTFTCLGNYVGDNTVNVNDLSGTFTVKAPPPPPEPEEGETVYVSVSVDGELLVAAQPVKIADMTIEAAIKAAHAKYYAGGESGYTAGIDPSFGMYLITQCWGVKQTPFIIINDHPNSETAPEPVNTTPVAANDNIIICTSNTQGAATPVSLAATLSGDSVTLTATVWTLNMSTFTYTHAPLADANVIDPTTGESLGTTDADGSITVTVPESGVIAIEGLAAIDVNASATPE